MKKMRLAALILVLALVIGAIVFFGILPDRVGSSMNPVLNAPPYNASEEAKALHAELTIVDLHADSLLWNRDLLERGYGQTDLPRLQEANVAIQAFTVVTKSPASQNIESNTANARDNITLLAIAQRWPIRSWFSLKERALYQANRLHELERRAGGDLTILRTSGDVDDFLERRKENAKLVGGFLGIEGLHCMEGDIANLDVFYEAGFRMMGITHFFDNKVGGSAHGVEKYGLTELGREVVKRMDEKKIIIDLAHASPKVIDDVLELTTRPVVVSHTGVRGICDNQRNVSDDHLKGIAATGGVIGIGIWETAVCGVDAGAVARAMRYTADLVGVDHVALGTDNDGSIVAPFDITGIVQITEALMEEGFSSQEIGKIMGGNTIRVLREALPTE